MSKIDKLIQELLSGPRDFTYDDLVRGLSHFEYEEIRKGKTAGSTIAFANRITKHIIRLQAPPGNILKMYVVDYVVGELKSQGVI